MTKVTTLFFCIFLACLSQVFAQKESKFPTNIRTQKTSRHTRVSGTKVFLEIPQEYQHIKALARYQKNENAYVQILESKDKNFEDASKTMTKEYIEKQGAKINTLKNLKLNGFNAIYADGPSKHEGETKIILMFGDKSFMVMMLGVCKTADLAGKEELKKILASTYYDTTLKIDDMELANFEIDLSVANFKFVESTTGVFFYNNTGKKEDDTDSIVILAMAQLSEKNAQAYIHDLIQRYERDAVLSEKSITKETINGYTAFVLNTKANLNGEIITLYTAVLLGEASSVVFMGTGKSKNFLDRVEATIYTIKIK